MDNLPETLLEVVRFFADLDHCHESERWVAMPSHPNYIISSCGRVISKPRRVKQGHGWRDIPATLLTITPDPAGYGSVRVSGRTLRVHRLVLTAFVGPCPSGQEGRHLNGVNSDNHLSNLAWATHAENIGDRIAHGTAPIGERTYNAKLTDGDVATIRERLAAGESQHSIARDYPVSRSTIQAIKVGRNWHHA